MTPKIQIHDESSHSSWSIELPCAIEADWHQQWGPRMAGFPLELVYSETLFQTDNTQESRVIQARYRLDLSSFLEDDTKKQVRYLPVLQSDYYVLVTWDKATQTWRTDKFQGDRLVAQTTGNTFQAAMIQTLLIGLQPDEPAE